MSRKITKTIDENGGVTFKVEETVEQSQERTVTLAQINLEIARLEEALAEKKAFKEVLQQPDEVVDKRSK